MEGEGEGIDREKIIIIQQQQQQQKRKTTGGAKSFREHVLLLLLLFLSEIPLLSSVCYVIATAFSIVMLDLFTAASSQ